MPRALAKQTLISFCTDCRQKHTRRTDKDFEHTFGGPQVPQAPPHMLFPNILALGQGGRVTAEREPHVPSGSRSCRVMRLSREQRSVGRIRVVETLFNRRVRVCKGILREGGAEALCWGMHLLLSLS